MKIPNTIISFLFFLNPALSKPLSKDVEPPRRLVSDFGDLKIGALVPVHLQRSNETLCEIYDRRFSYIRSRDGTVQCYKLNVAGVMWSEAIRFSVLAANKLFFSRWNFTLGYDIRDSVNNVDVASETALDFSLQRKRLEMNSNSSRECECSVNTTVPYVVALIGGARSEISQRVNTIVGISSLPQISYSSTSVTLSDKKTYKTFLRTIPPDNFQARAMVDIVKTYGWTYVATVATDEAYGRRGIEGFHEEARKGNICISTQRLFHFNISSAETKREIKDIVRELKADTKTNVIVLFCERPRAVAILTEAQAQGMTGKTWIATEDWGFSERIYDFPLSTVGGVLGVVTHATPLPIFEDYLSALTPNTSSHSPWLMEYYQQQSCTTGQKDCKIDPSLSAAMMHRNKASYVMDAVYTVTLSLDRHFVWCSKQGLDKQHCLKELDLKTLREYMLAVNTNGSSTRVVSYDKFGNPADVYYNISNLQPDPTSPKGKRFVHVGSWLNGRLSITRPIFWNGWKNATPVSVCSVSCPPGHYYVKGDVSCCWKCVFCPTGTFKISTGNKGCDQCPNGYTSDLNRTRCVRIPEEFIRWDSVTSAVLVSLSLFGVLVTIFMFGVYFKYRKTPIVKAASRYPSLMLLVSVAFLFALPLLYIGRPNLAVCHIQPIAFGLLMTLASSLVLTKTFRLIQIFNNVVANLRDKPLVTVKTQFIMVAVIVILEAIMIAVFLDRRPIMVNTVVEDAAVPIDCGSSAKDLHTAVLLYNWLLAIICAIMAFRARSLPANFSEARLISFAMFTYSVIWLSFLIVFSGSFISQFSTYICVCILATGMDLVVCMFGPKIFVILFKPELNEMHVVRADIYRYTMKQRARSHTPNPESSESELTRAQLEGSLPRPKSAHVLQESKL